MAKDIGDSEATVRGWIRRYKEHGKNAFPGSRNLGPDDEEIRRLKKRSADIEEENAILYPIGHAKKAILIFTKP